MVALLARIFIGKPGDYQDPGVRQKYGVLCGTVGVVLNIILCSAKFVLGAMTSSVATVADAFNNLFDAASSVIQIAAFRLASKKPDREHPFGHGRIEYIAGLVISFLILYTGIELVRKSIMCIMNPESVVFSWAALAVMGCAVLVKVYIYIYNHSVGKKISSVAMEATAKDSLGDVVVTCVVMAGMVSSRFTDFPVDAVCGIAVGGFIVKNGVSSFRDTVSPLMGLAATQEFVDRVEEIALGHKPIFEIHDVMVHDYGPGRRMVSLHAEVPGDVDVFELHDALDSCEEDIFRILGCRAVIHMDPVDLNDSRLMEIKKIIREEAGKIDPDLNVHDVRLVEKGGEKKILFELLKPPSLKMKDEELCTMVCGAVRMRLPDMECEVREINTAYL